MEITNNIIEFLRQSNFIEDERLVKSLYDAISAWKFAYKNKDKINLKYILEIHRRLLKNLRPDIAGKLRNCDVFIGGHRKFFISETLLKEELRDVILTMNVANFEKNKEEEFAKHCHVMFENIHPFEDGNGRTGRILWQIQRLNLGLPIKIIYEGDDQENYYGWFA